MAREKIRCELKDLGTKIQDVLAQAAQKNEDFIRAEARNLPYDAQRYITTRTYRDSGLNVRSGNLVGQNYPIIRESGTDYELGIRNPMVYAAIHEFGGLAGRGHTAVIPERPFIRPALELAADEFIRKCMAEGGIGL